MKGWVRKEEVLFISILTHLRGLNLNTLVLPVYLLTMIPEFSNFSN